MTYTEILKEQIRLAEAAILSARVLIDIEECRNDSDFKGKHAKILLENMREQSEEVYAGLWREIRTLQSKLDELKKA